MKIDLFNTDPWKYFNSPIIFNDETSDLQNLFADGYKALFAIGVAGLLVSGSIYLIKIMHGERSAEDKKILLNKFLLTWLLFALPTIFGIVWGLIASLT